MTVPVKMDKKTAVTALAVSAVLVLTLLPRYLMFPFESMDYGHLRAKEYEFISMNGYIHALQHGSSGYSVAYLYLLSIFSLLNAPSLLAVKGISIAFDYLAAFFVYRCVRLKYPGRRIVPILAGLAALFAPTMLLNSSALGHTDAIYASFLVMSLYFLLIQREKMACAAFGLALSFEFQAVFLAPLFLWLLAMKAIRLRNLSLIPTVWLGLLLPAWLVGRPGGELLLTGPARVGPGVYSRSAPNLHTWVPNYLDFFFVPAGLAAAMTFLLVMAALLYMSRTKLTEDAIVLLAAFSVLVMPYILPEMHERCFFPADVISIVLAFYFPRFWYVPVMIGLTSLLAYTPFLGGYLPVKLAVLALFVLWPVGILGQGLGRFFAGKTSKPSPYTVRPGGSGETCRT